MITNDPVILSWIQGYTIPFITEPVQTRTPLSRFSKAELPEIRKSINDLLNLGAIVPCKEVQGQYLSDFFLIPKPNKKFRFILNLKSLNKYIFTSHFKMEDIRTCTRLLCKNSFMTTIDLKEAYFLVSVAYKHRKFLRFYYQQFYEFTALPYGLCTAPSVFTKLLKPVISYIRSLGYTIVIYLDDILCIANSYETCQTQTTHIIKILENLGFILNYDKSFLCPSRCSKFLGFMIDSTDLTLALPLDKREKIKDKLIQLQRLQRCKIRDFAQLLGMLTAACPAIPFGWMYTKLLERKRYLALLASNENYNAYMKICPSIHNDIRWWLSKIMSSKNHFALQKFVLEIFTDASLTGWGAYCQKESIRGFWNHSEKKNHINYLELLAAYFGLKSFAKEMSNCHILLRIDNTTAIACINKMGSVQFVHLNSITRKIWQWCEVRNIRLVASYIRSKDNIEADKESRNINHDTEWELADYAFKEITTYFGHPTVDLFASRINAKCPKFVSWKRDPMAFEIDAFTLDWSKYFFYAFPPFSQITRCLEKISIDQAKGILVFPWWPSQPWFPLLKKLMVSKPIMFEPNNNLLLSPFSSQHRLRQHLTLAAGLFSGQHSS